MKTLFLTIVSIAGIGSALAALMIFGNIGPYTIPSHDWNTMSETQCGKFYTVPENKSDFNTIPVLILKPYSVGCAKLTFTINYKYDDPRMSSRWPEMAPVGEMLHIGKYNYVTNEGQYSVTSSDTTEYFQTYSIPDTMDLANFPVGYNFTVIYIIKPLSNSTGFYEYSIPKLPCNSYPLVVGYDKDQINASDFSLGLETMLNHSCMNAPYGISAVQVSGMAYTQMKLR